MDELQLIEGCKKHKRECQKYLYEKYAQGMYGICIRYAPNIETAQDLLQDGFLKVFSVINTYTGKGSFEGWLKRVFVNLALEHLRKEKNFVSNEEVYNLPDIAEGENENAGLISEEELMAMVKELPRGYQMVFNLYAIEDFSHKEISEMLNIAEGTSRSQYIRARQILQDKVREYFKKNS